MTVLSTDLDRTQTFYRLLGYRATFISDWFVSMTAIDNANFELGILHQEHELVPSSARGSAAGAMLSITVDDVDQVFRLLHDAGVQIEEPPVNLFYGQRRMLVKDPDGLYIDISSPCDAELSWLKRLESREDGVTVEVFHSDSTLN